MTAVERGTITRVAGRQVYVEVPKLGLGVEYGPCDVAWQSGFTLPSDTADSGTTTAHTHSTSSGATGSATATHRHALPSLAAGQRVIVGIVHGIPDDIVVLGIIG